MDRSRNWCTCPGRTDRLVRLGEKPGLASVASYVPGVRSVAIAPDAEERTWIVLSGEVNSTSTSGIAAKYSSLTYAMSTVPPHHGIHGLGGPWLSGDPGKGAMIPPGKRSKTFGSWMGTMKRAALRTRSLQASASYMFSHSPSSSSFSTFS